jgi:hypothetical protein
MRVHLSLESGNRFSQIAHGFEECSYLIRHFTVSVGRNLVLDDIKKRLDVDPNHAFANAGDLGGRRRRRSLWR